MEIWKDITGYKNLYQVTNQGIVKNKKRNKILKPSIDSSGYLQFNLSKGGKIKCFKAHQLVAIAFLNHIPNSKRFNVDHIDGDIYNNHLDNLQILTLREHRIKTLNKKFIGAQLDKRRNKWYSQIRTINGRKFLGYFDTQIEASNAYKQKVNTL